MMFADFQAELLSDEILLESQQPSPFIPTDLLLQIFHLVLPESLASTRILKATLVVHLQHRNRTPHQLLPSSSHPTAQMKLLEELVPHVKFVGKIITKLLIVIIGWITPIKDIIHLHNLLLWWLK
jgi:hypothetical protein